MSNKTVVAVALLGILGALVVKGGWAQKESEDKGKGNGHFGACFCPQFSYSEGPEPGVCLFYCLHCDDFSDAAREYECSTPTVECPGCEGCETTKVKDGPADAKAPKPAKLKKKKQKGQRPHSPTPSKSRILRQSLVIQFPRPEGREEGDVIYAEVFFSSVRPGQVMDPKSGKPKQLPNRLYANGHEIEEPFPQDIDHVVTAKTDVMDKGNGVYEVNLGSLKCRVMTVTP